MCDNKMKYNKAIMCKVENDYEDLCSVLDSFNGVGHEPINKEQLMSFEVGKWYDVNDKVKIRRRKYRFKEYLNFDTVMKKGGEFGKHFHEDLIESTEVLQGEMIDLKDQKVYYVGDVMEYGKGQKHTPIATKDTILHVLFKP